MQEIKKPNHEAANSTYVTMLMEQIEFLKEVENKVKNSIIQSLTNQYNNIFNTTTTHNSKNNDNKKIIIILSTLTIILTILLLIIMTITIIIIMIVFLIIHVLHLKLIILII